MDAAFAGAFDADAFETGEELVGASPGAIGWQAAVGTVTVAPTSPGTLS